MSRLLLQPLTMESCVMSRSYVPRAYSFSRYGDAKPGDVVDIFGKKVVVPEPEPVNVPTDYVDPLIPCAHEFTPGETIALLELRCSSISMAVVRKLKHSTARASAKDYVSLRERGYAKREPGEIFHTITPKGLYKAGALARELAKLLEIKPAEYASHSKPYGHNSTGFGDSWFR